VWISNVSLLFYFILFLFTYLFDCFCVGVGILRRSVGNVAETRLVVMEKGICAIT
jgi:hypothetical protein